MTIKVTYNVTDVYVTQDVSPVYINVSYSTGSSGGSAVWGGITGTLSDQTDLQTALDLKVPYSGATANVDLGEYELKAGQVEFDQTPTGTAGVGVMRWNDSDGTLDLGLKGGNVTLQLGQEQVARVVNKSGVNLLESAYQVVKVTDAQGQRLAVDLAQGNNDANSTDTIGIVTENIDNNQEGFITTSGIVRNINTTGSLQGETWNDGDVLYLSPTTAGAITNIKPTAPNHTVILGYVVYAHAVNGKIFVKCDNGYELGELHDCYLPTPSNNDGIFWNSTNLRYENKSVSSALGYTPANSATTLTINGVTYDLSANRTWTISTGISGSGASGQVSYWDGTTSQAGTNNLFWDNANGRLGIGTNAPSSAISILKPVGQQATMTFRTLDNTSSNGYSGFSCFDESNNLAFSFAYGNTGSAYSNTAIIGARTSTGRTQFVYGASATVAATLFSNGNFAFGTTTDSGQRLQVQGTTLLNGNVTFSSSTGMFWDATNSRLGIGTNAPAAALTINSAGTLVTGIRFDNAGSIGTIFGDGTSMNIRSGNTHGIQVNSGSASLVQSNASVGGFRVDLQTLTNAPIYSYNADADTGIGRAAADTLTFYAGGEKARIFSTGNLLLQNGGTFTDSGERLQVTGTAKITTSLDIAGGKVFSGYQSSVANDALKISASNLSAPFGVQNTNAAGFSGIEYINNSGTVQVFTGFNNNNNQEFRFNNIATGGFIDFLISSTSALRIFNNRSVSINSNTDIASAQFQITSTTRGFLPPRMTTTQKNAISSPAAGLVVYDTTLAKLCVYTTAWETITSI